MLKIKKMFKLGHYQKMNPKYPKEWLEKVPAEVFGCLCPGELRIVLIPSGGTLDGGVHHDFPVETIPPELRMPNTRLWIHLNADFKIVRAWRREE